MPLSVLIFFGILFVFVCALRMAKIGALVAFLVAGILSGPYVLNLFELNQTWEFLGNMGIMFLWFNIGLEINIKRLWTMRRTIFGFGAAQVMMAAVMMFPLLFGLTHWSVLGCIMVALVLAMSSTSEDLNLLTERNQLNTGAGRQTFSILLFQDLLSIPLLAMLPVFAGKSFNLGATAIDIAVLSVLLVLSVVVVGRFILNPLLRRVANLKSREALLLAVMINIVLWAVVMDLMGLPAGLGAFLAGMLMSETIYRHQISAEINPYAMLFMAFFFISLGMGLDLSLLIGRWYIVLGGLVGLVAVKFMAMFMVARVRHVPVADAAFIALILAQGGEFGLLILHMMKAGGINAIPDAHAEILSAVIILSIMATPVLLAVFDYLRRSGRLFASANARALNDAQPGAVPNVIICGFGRVGRIVAQMLDAGGVPYVAIDMDVNAVMQGRENGFNVVYGNTTNRDVLLNFGLAPRKTRAVVVALDNAEVARRTVLTVKSVAPRVRIFARARNLAESKILRRHGVCEALPETIESSFFLARGVMSHLGISDVRIGRMLDAMRADNYAALDSNTDAQE